MSRTACPDASQPDFVLSLADGPADVKAAQRLRYAVFVEELGGDGEFVDHTAGREADRFDGHCDHLLLRDMARTPGTEVVGVYRLLREAGAREAGGFYTEAEYDLSPVRASGRPLLELGRSCLHRDYRGGAAMYHLWTGIADYVGRHGIELMFGTASFHGTDIDRLAEPLSMLHHRHLAAEEIRVRARPPGARSMDLLPVGLIDRARATRAVPALIKAYLRLGGSVGEGAFVDRRFNTTDVCLLMDTTRLSDRARAIYGRRRG
jgi:L-ornithine Nalpha-acyltransferase